MMKEMDKETGDGRRGSRPGFNRRDFLQAAGLSLAFSPFCVVSESGAAEAPGGGALQGTPFTRNALLGKGSEIAVSPDKIWRDASGDFVITVKLGEGGLAKGDSLCLVHGSYIDRWQFSFPSHHWGAPVPWTCKKKGPGTVSAECGRPGVSLDVKIGRPLPQMGWANNATHLVDAFRKLKRAVLSVTPSERLEAGDVVTIRWGRAKAPPYAMHYFFLPFIMSKLPRLDRDLPIRRGEFDDLPRIRVAGRGAERFYVTTAPLRAVGEEFPLNIAAVDKYGNLAEDFAGTVRLEADGPVACPREVVFAPEDRGHKRVAGLRGSAPGWFKVRAAAGAVSGASNYIVLSGGKPDFSLYFGDMHAHTLDCDATNDIREHLFYGPNVAGFDFGSVSPHAEYFGCKAAWDRYLREVAKANRPGEFVCFPGYEWAMGMHINVYFLDEKDAVLFWGEERMVRTGNPPDDPPFRIAANDEAELMRKVKALTQPAFAMAHVHTKFTKGIDDTVLWLEETYSCHLYPRKVREQRLRDILARGFNVGVVAGSDMHRLTFGHLCKTPGARWPQGGWERCQYQTAGIQATFADGLTRGSLYDAMKRRRTYGTTGARIVLFFDCDGRRMGSRIGHDPSAPNVFTIEAGGTAPLTEIALSRWDGKSWTMPLVKKIRGESHVKVAWKDPAAGKGCIYYARVTQADGEQAWCSPIWLV